MTSQPLLPLPEWETSWTAPENELNQAAAIAAWAALTKTHTIKPKEQP
jgi:hypothetical protein